MILSMESFDFSKSTQWTSNSFYTYFRKNPSVPIEETQEKLDGLVRKYVSPEIEQYLGMTMEEFESKGDSYRYWTQPMLDIHLKSNYEGELMPGGNIAYLYVFGAVAVFIILLASQPIPGALTQPTPPALHAPSRRKPGIPFFHLPTV